MKPGSQLSCTAIPAFDMRGERGTNRKLQNLIFVGGDATGRPNLRAPRQFDLGFGWQRAVALDDHGLGRILLFNERQYLRSLLAGQGLDPQEFRLARDGAARMLPDGVGIGLGVQRQHEDEVVAKPDSPHAGRKSRSLSINLGRVIRNDNARFAPPDDLWEKSSRRPAKSFFLGPRV